MLRDTNTNETLAYLAGFFDGEGHITIERTSSQKQGVPGSSQMLRIGACNTDPRPVELLYRTLGGSLRVTTPKGIPKSGGEYATQYIWRLKSSEAKECLKALLPFLIVKRERADLAIAFEELRQHHFKLFSTQRHPDEAWAAREAIRDKLLTMNKRSCKKNKGPRAQPVGRGDRSLRAQRVGNVVSLRQEAG